MNPERWQRIEEIFRIAELYEAWGKADKAEPYHAMLQNKEKTSPPPKNP